MTYEERAAINFHHPRSIDFELLVQHLKELKAGNNIDQPVYSFVSHNRTSDTVFTHPRKVMIVEGILILATRRPRADWDERFKRALKPTLSSEDELWLNADDYPSDWTW